MKVTCIKAFGNARPGDEAEVPDGAAVDPEFWERTEEPVTPPPPDDPPPPEPAAPAALDITSFVKGM